MACRGIKLMIFVVTLGLDNYSKSFGNYKDQSWNLPFPACGVSSQDNSAKGCGFSRAGMDRQMFTF